MANKRYNRLLRTMMQDGNDRAIHFSSFSRAIPEDMGTAQVEELLDYLSRKGIEIIDDVGGDERESLGGAKSKKFAIGATKSSSKPKA